MGYKKLLGLCYALKEDGNYGKLEEDLRKELEKELKKSEGKMEKQNY